MPGLSSLPPWLDASPAQFGNAAGEGARLDLQRQQLEMDTAQHVAQMTIAKQEADRGFALQQAQQAFEHQLRSTQLSMQAAQVSRKFAAQQQYAKLVQSGMDPAKAMLQVGPSLGINMVGAGQLARWGETPAPPQQFDGGESGKGVVYNHRYYPAKPQAQYDEPTEINGQMFQKNNATGKLEPVGKPKVQGNITPQQKARIKVLQDGMKAMESTPAFMAQDTNSPAMSKWNSYKSELDQLTSGTTSQSTPDPANPDATATESEDDTNSPAAPTTPALSRFKIIPVGQ